MKYCPYCQRYVRPIEERDNTGCIMKIIKFIVILILTGITAGIFLLIYILAKLFSRPWRMVCPICNAKL